MSPTTLAFLVAGLALLLVGGEFLVRGAVAVATRLGVSRLLAGLVIVGFGTSTPELMTSINAALSGSPGIAVGNVVGSNIANLFLILGIAALLFPVPVEAAAFRRDGTVLAVVTAIGLGVLLLGHIDRLIGAALILGIIAYVVTTYVLERRRHTLAERIYVEEAELKTSESLGLAAGLGLSLAGLVGVVVGADWLVKGAVEIAAAAGVSETVIGLTLVAIGTSLPELATVIVAGLRRQTDIAIGNVIGSNIFNILFILGATALVQPIPVPLEIIAFDAWAMAVATGLTLFLIRTGWQVTRFEGGLLLASYGIYLWIVF
ncbi:MAG: sodium:calcium antiporter [Geminicoccaceae bacterium]|nr:MAG: sodium:calcium antiporter [Geminicoccaceae bacterium]